MLQGSRQADIAGALLVLDTNVALDWVAFDDPRVRPIVRAIESGTLSVVSNQDCLEELRRALGYVQVRLDAAAQARALARYLARVKLVDRPAAVADLPRCEDPDDQKFLELALGAGASHLLTRDKALLTLAPRCVRHFAILAPDAFAQLLSAVAGSAQPD